MIQLASLTRNLVADEIANSISTSITFKAKAQGSMQIWGGRQPANADLPPSGILMATLPFGAPAFTPAATGVVTAIIANTKPSLPDYLSGTINGGTMSWFRIRDAGGNNICDGAIKTSGGDLTVPTLTVPAGNYAISKFQISIPAKTTPGTGTFRLSSMTANAVVDALAKSMNGPGTNIALMKIYTGTQPTSGDAPPTGTLLAVLGFSTQAYQEAGIVNAGFAVNNAISGIGQVIAQGTMGWFRIQTGSGLALLDGSIGRTGQDLNFDTAAVVVGGTIVINSLPLSLTRAA